MGRAIDVGALLKRAERSKERTENARIAKRERHGKRKMVSSGKDVPDFELTHPEGGQTRKKVLTKDVREWFREGITKRIRWSVTIPPNKNWWKGKQSMLSRRLLDAYGGNLVKKAVFYLCDNWEDMVKDSGGKLSGLPTVELLWASRERIFPHVEMGRPYVSPPKRSMYQRKPDLDPDEFREVEGGKVSHGW